MTIFDTNTSTNEVYTDGGTGVLGVNSTTSTILGTYWTGSIQTAVANNNDPNAAFAEFINASINLNATASPLGENVIVRIEASEFVVPADSPARYDTIINASTLIDAEFNASVFIDGNLVLEETVTNTDTETASGILDIGNPYNLVHAFGLVSLADDGDIGFDISTRVSGVPVPAPLALIGLGLAGIGFTRRFF
jgi:hypothetical protein